MTVRSDLTKVRYRGYQKMLNGELSPTCLYGPYGPPMSGPAKS